MRFINVLPLVALATAFVIPDEALINQIDERIAADAVSDSPSWFDVDGVRAEVEHVVEKLPTQVFDKAYTLGKKIVHNALDLALADVEDEGYTGDFESMERYAAEAWAASAVSEQDAVDQKADMSDIEHPHHPPHHGKPHHGHKPHKTVYELIASSKYTTKLAALIDDYPDLVDALNGTAANYTIFAPTDAAFAKIPDHGKKPPKEFIRKILAYHVSPHFYPAGRVLLSHTIPTTLGEKSLGDYQRLRVDLGLRGLTLNFYSKIVAVNIFGTNGVIHGIDSLLIPPPTVGKVIDLLPGQFSTFNLALAKTKYKAVSHVGATVFAPSNFAFKKLGPRINAFLFSPYGEKYLKALLDYHIVVNQTLYSDAYYNSNNDESSQTSFPKGHFHVDLPTLLGDKSLSIDIGRYGRLIDIRINGYTSVAIQDGVARDGVLQVPRSVLIPPKTPHGAADSYDGGEIELEDLKERLEPYIKDDEEPTEEL